jgi:hypothetical protein
MMSRRVEQLAAIVATMLGPDLLGRDASAGKLMRKDHRSEGLRCCVTDTLDGPAFDIFREQYSDQAGILFVWKDADVDLPPFGGPVGN